MEHPHALGNIWLCPTCDRYRGAAFTQDYRSDTYHDRGTKTLGLVKTEGVWKIAQEMWRR